MAFVLKSTNDKTKYTFPFLEVNIYRSTNQMLCRQERMFCAYRVAQSLKKSSKVERGGRWDNSSQFIYGLAEFMV